MYGEGIYLTSDPKRARLYGDKVIPLYVKATTDFREAKKTGKPRDYTYVKQTGDIVVISPEQIKSATNNIGTFDGTNPDIRYSIDSPTDPFQEAIQRMYDREKAEAEKETRKMGYIPIDFVFIDNEYGISYLIPKGHFTCAPKVKIQWAASPYTTIFARMML